MMRKVAWLLLGTAFMVTAGCASSTPPAAPTVNVTGNWVGTWVYEAAGVGSGTVQFSFQQTGAAVTGQMNIQGARATSGPITGSVSGNVLSIEHSQGKGSGVVNGDQITGTAVGQLAGRFTLTRAR